MTTYSILSKKAGGAADDTAIVIPDRFTWLGFAFSGLWLLWHRVWFAAVPVLVIFVLGMVLAVWPAWAAAVSVLSFFIQLYVGFEGNQWRVEALRQRGYELVDIVEAADPETAFEIHAHRAVGSAPSRRAAPPPLPAVRPAYRPASSSAGLAGLGSEG